MAFLSTAGITFWLRNCDTFCSYHSHKSISAKKCNAENNKLSGTAPSSFFFASLKTRLRCASASSQPPCEPDSQRIEWIALPRSLPPSTYCSHRAFFLPGIPGCPDSVYYYQNQNHDIWLYSEDLELNCVWNVLNYVQNVKICLNNDLENASW